MIYHAKLFHRVLSAFLLGCVVLCTALAEAQPAKATKRVTARKSVPRKSATPRKTTPKKVAPKTTAQVRPSITTGTVEAYREAARQRAIELVKQAAITFEKGDYQKTIELCKTANAAYPTYARAYTWMGASYQKLGKTDEAISAFRWVTALAPNTPDAERAERGLREMGYYNR